MANEVNVRSGMIINNTQSGGEIQDTMPGPQAFYGNMVGNAGPVPGSVFVSHHGSTITFTGLTTPAYGWIKNLDTTYDLHYGIWVPSLARGFPLLKVGPGEIYPIRISEFLGEDFTGGTGTGSADNAQLWIIGVNPAGQWVNLSIYEH